jgi:peptidoglycan/xylan/chitin deacetylase (PgdA/CDA1 family)
VKRLKIKSLGIAGLVVIGLMVLGIYFTGGLTKGVPVLSYHKVEDNSVNPLALTTQEFEEQMAYLASNGYTAISPDQLLAHLKQGAQLPEKPVLITFDDGYRDNYTNAYPIMKKYGFTATIFLLTDAIGHDDWYLDWEQVRQMRRDGFVFGSHTLSHVALTDVSEEYAMFQLVKSREGMEWRLDEPVKYLAYPTGAYDARVEKLTKQAGYEAAFTVKFGRVGKGSDLYALERLPLFGSKFTFADFYARLNFTLLVEGLKEIKYAITENR